MKKYIESNTSMNNDELKDIAREVMIYQIEDGYFEWKEKFASYIQEQIYYDLTDEEIKTVDKYVHTLMIELWKAVRNIKL